MAKFEIDDYLVEESRDAIMRHSPVLYDLKMALDLVDGVSATNSKPRRKAYITIYRI